MHPLNFPDYNFRTRLKDGQLQIFDPVRRRFAALTPEEWVRQNVIQYLNVEKLVPLHMMASERGIKVNRLQKRFDLVVYAPTGLPVMIVECKAPGVQLNEEVFYQIARYNMTLKVNHLLVSNGLNHIYCKIDYSAESLIFEELIPPYSAMI